MENEINKCCEELKKRLDILEEKIKIKDNWKIYIDELEYFALIGEGFPDSCNFELIRKIAFDYINYRTKNVLKKFGDQGLCPWQIDLLKQAMALLMKQICCEGDHILEPKKVSSESLGSHSKTYNNKSDSVLEIIKVLIRDSNIQSYEGVKNCGGQC